MRHSSPGGQSPDKWYVYLKMMPCPDRCSTHELCPQSSQRCGHPLAPVGSRCMPPSGATTLSSPGPWGPRPAAPRGVRIHPRGVRPTAASLSAIAWHVAVDARKRSFPFGELPRSSLDDDVAAMPRPVGCAQPDGEGGGRLEPNEHCADDQSARSPNFARTTDDSSGAARRRDGRQRRRQTEDRRPAPTGTKTDDRGPTADDNGDEDDDRRHTTTKTATGKTKDDRQRQTTQDDDGRRRAANGTAGSARHAKHLEVFSDLVYYCGEARECERSSGKFGGERFAHGVSL